MASSSQPKSGANERRGRRQRAETPVQHEAERLQKILARAGVASRREVESLIEQGRVLVNGEPAVLGQKVTMTDQIDVDGRRLELSASLPVRRVIMYNKPEGEVTTRNDPEGRPTVFDRLPRIKDQRWISIGRLDINTTGLILFTTDGELANRLMHPSYQVDREYAVRVFGEVTEEMIARLREGVLLEDGMARFSDISEAGGKGMNQWYHVSLLEGRNREVRRLWESQGVTVSRLKRVRYGTALLPSRLSIGRWEELDQRAVDALSRMVGLEPVQLPQKTPDEQAAQERSRRKRPARSAAKPKSDKGSWAVTTTRPGRGTKPADKPARQRSPHKPR